MERNLIRVPKVCPVDHSSNVGKAVTADGNLTGATGAIVYGIIHIGATTADATELVTGGEVDALLNGSGSGNSIAIGDPLTGAAGGKLIKGTVGTHHVCAIALEAASADNVVARIKLL